VDWEIDKLVGGIMLNEISLRRIKSFLSLRTLFPFCHSRESGNPSSLSLREAKRRSNLSGFSLIELMVAVAILAMAIFGIFQAYSVGFMGMADARDRTVATNYAREAMEDIKNIDFDQIVTQERTAISGNTKYEREVIVQPSINLKKVTSKVYWKDRKGTWKIVETGMVIHFIETTAGTPSKIILYAEPYSILTDDDGDTNDIYEDESIITAIVKDDKGNTITTWDKNIDFGLVDTGGGNLSSITVTPDNFINGKAIITFTSGTEAEEVIITASSTDLTSDSVIINITDPEEPVKINLTADTYFMTPSMSSTSLITAEIFDAGNTLVESATNEIAFSVTGPGTLPSPTTKPAVDGEATITLTSDGTPGTITVTGSSSIFSSNSSVAINETAVIGISTKDLYGFLINYEGTIDLSVVGVIGDPEYLPGDGDLSSYSISFNGDTYLGTVDFTATSEGKVKITATDSSGILDPGELILIITPALIPHHIDVSAKPPSIKAGGTDTSMITARVKTADNVTVTSYSELIEFTTDLGTFPDGSTTIDTSNNSLVSYENGVASVELNAASDVGAATITVTSGSLILGTVEVKFYIEADNILLKADPQNISAGGQSCTITAIIRDGETTVSDYNGPVTFTIMEGYPSGVKFTVTNQSSITITAESGKAYVDLQSKNWAGTAKIKATASEGIPPVEGFLNIPVGISLNLIDGTVSYIGDTISFDIKVLGADLLLEEIQVSWDSPSDENLNKIEVNDTPIFYIGDESNGPIGSITYTDDLITLPNVRIADVNVEDITLSTGVSNVKLYCNAGDNMFGKNIEVIFNPNSGNYRVDFTVPE